MDKHYFSYPKVRCHITEEVESTISTLANFNNVSASDIAIYLREKGHSKITLKDIANLRARLRQSRRTPDAENEVKFVLYIQLLQSVRGVQIKENYKKLVQFRYFKSNKKVIIFLQNLFEPNLCDFLGRLGHIFRFFRQPFLAVWCIRSGQLSSQACSKYHAAFIATHASTGPMIIAEGDRGAGV